MALINYTITASTPSVKVDLIQVNPIPVGSEIISTITYPDTASDPEVITDSFIVDNSIETTYKIKATDSVNHIVYSDLIVVAGNSYAYLVDFDGTYLLDSDNKKLTVYNQ